jgi:hypothetical protein
VTKKKTSPYRIYLRFQRFNGIRHSSECATIEDAAAAMKALREDPTVQNASTYYTDDRGTIETYKARSAEGAGDPDKIAPPAGKSNIFYEGWRAFEAGYDLESNPYAGKLAKAWKDAFKERSALDFADAP